MHRGRPAPVDFASVILGIERDAGLTRRAIARILHAAPSTVGRWVAG